MGVIMEMKIILNMNNVNYQIEISFRDDGAGKNVQFKS